MKKHTRRKDPPNDDIASMGTLAIKGITTVGTTAIAAQLMGGIVGSMPKLPP